MERTVFANGWQDYFAGYGLKSFDDFFEIQADHKVLDVSKRYVNCVTLGNGAEARTFFIKRFRYSHTSDILHSLAHFGCVCTQAGCEWLSAHYLLKKGFQAYKPVCYGERTALGFELKSFFVSEALDSQSLMDFVRENWDRISRDDKCQIVSSLGRHIRKMHDAGVGLTDLYIWHVFIEQRQDGGHEFAVIDLHRMKHRFVGRAEFVKNLGRFDYSLRAEYFDDSLRRLLIESYAGSSWPGGSDRLWRDVRRYSARLSRKRKTKQYLKKDFSVQ